MNYTVEIAKGAERPTRKGAKNVPGVRLYRALFQMEGQAPSLRGMMNASNISSTAEASTALALLQVQRSVHLHHSESCLVLLPKAPATTIEDWKTEPGDRQVWLVGDDGKPHFQKLESFFNPSRAGQRALELYRGLSISEVPNIRNALDSFQLSDRPRRLVFLELLATGYAVTVGRDDLFVAAPGTPKNAIWHAIQEWKLTRLPGGANEVLAPWQHVTRVHEALSDFYNVATKDLKGTKRPATAVSQDPDALPRNLRLLAHFFHFRDHFAALNPRSTNYGPTMRAFASQIEVISEHFNQYGPPGEYLWFDDVLAEHGFKVSVFERPS